MDHLLKKQGCVPFSCGMNQDLQKSTLIRKNYIEALQLADRGDYRKLRIFVES